MVRLYNREEALTVDLNGLSLKTEDLLCLKISLVDSLEISGKTYLGQTSCQDHLCGANRK